MATTFILQRESARYFRNPFFASASEAGHFVDEEWLLRHTKALAKVVASASLKMPISEYEDDGPYVGPCEVAYALLRPSKVSDNLQEFGTCVKQIVDRQREYNARIRLSDAHKSRYLTGTLGFSTVEAICGSQLSAQPDVSATAANYRGLLETVLKPGYQKIGDDELLNGRAGFLAGLQTLRCELGKDILTDGEVTRVLQAMVQSGRDYARRHKSPSKLMYQWHNSEYLGAAHGVSGIFQTLLSYSHLLDESAKADLKQSVDWFLSIQSTDGNFPSSSDRIR